MSKVVSKKKMKLGSPAYAFAVVVSLARIVFTVLGIGLIVGVYLVAPNNTVTGFFYQAFSVEAFSASPDSPLAPQDIVRMLFAAVLMVLELRYMMKRQYNIALYVFFADLLLHAYFHVIPFFAGLALLLMWVGKPEEPANSTQPSQQS